MSKLARDHRNADLAAIHMAKKHLNLGEEEYRTILMRQAGVTSARDLDHDGRRKVRAYLNAAKPFGQPELIAWLWRKLGEAGAIQDTSSAALLAFVERTASVGSSHLKFLPVADASKVIEALKAMLNRAGKK